MNEAVTSHDEIIASLAGLAKGQEHIIARLDKINGSVGHLWEGLNNTRLDLVKHTQECPLKERIIELDTMLLSGEHPGSARVNERLNALEQQDAALKRADCTRKEWLEWLRPLIWIFVCIIVALALKHPEDVIPFVKR